MAKVAKKLKVKFIYLRRQWKGIYICMYAVQKADYFSCQKPSYFELSQF